VIVEAVYDDDAIGGVEEEINGDDLFLHVVAIRV